MNRERERERENKPPFMSSLYERTRFIQPPRTICPKPPTRCMNDIHTTPSSAALANNCRGGDIIQRKWSSRKPKQTAPEIKNFFNPRTAADFTSLGERRRMECNPPNNRLPLRVALMMTQHVYEYAYKVSLHGVLLHGGPIRILQYKPFPRQEPTLMEDT